VLYLKYTFSWKFCAGCFFKTLQSERNRNFGRIQDGGEKVFFLIEIFPKRQKNNLTNNSTFIE
jgi:hypothetical protein